MFSKSAKLALPETVEQTFSKSERDAIVGIYTLFKHENIIKQDEYDITIPLIENDELFKTTEQIDSFNLKLSTLRKKLHNKKNKTVNRRRKYLETYIFDLPPTLQTIKRNRDFVAFLL